MNGSKGTCSNSTNEEPKSEKKSNNLKVIKPRVHCLVLHLRHNSITLSHKYKQEENLTEFLFLSGIDQY
jgi:hypothetical protein